MKHKIWSIEEARKILNVVKVITKDCYEKVEFLSLELNTQIFPENIMEYKEEELKSIIENWFEQIQSLGALVKGLWIVDFDNGNGYYCWKFGEEELLYEHSYESGFNQRKLIEEER